MTAKNSTFYEALELLDSNRVKSLYCQQLLCQVAGMHFQVYKNHCRMQEFIIDLLQSKAYTWAVTPSKLKTPINTIWALLSLRMGSLSRNDIKAGFFRRNGFADPINLLDGLLVEQLGWAWFFMSLLVQSTRIAVELV